MKKKTKTYLFLGVALLLLFVIFTVSLGFVDVKPIGPRGSSVAYATLNGAVHDLLPMNETLYNITDWAGLAVFAIVLGFAVLGLVQWIKRRHILRVDSSILVLEVFYLLMFGVYIFFEFTVINCRPVLINGYLEASYPSSTTMRSMCVLPTAIMELRRLIRNRKIAAFVTVVLAAFTAFMVIGRTLSGVHWITDILGGVIFSVSFILLDCGANLLISDNKEKRQRKAD